MQTTRIPVAEGIELAVDTWAPAPEGGQVGPDALARMAAVDAPMARPAFVLVHGLASNARMWDGVALALSALGHRVSTVDLRGHGRSSKPDGPYDMATVADDVAAVIDALGDERPIVAGQSWGGNVVLELAARHPDRVRGIVCVDGGWLEPSASFPTWEACRDALAPPRLAGLRRDQIEAFMRGAHPDWPETGILGALANFEVRPDGTVAPWLTFDRHLAVLRGLWDHRPSVRYAAVPVPVLLVPADSGDDPRAQGKRAGVEAALAALPCAQVRWFTGDHDIHAQHPAELASVMHDLTTNGWFA